MAADDLLKLATAHEGHFRLESGHHGGMWLDLDGLFTDVTAVGPHVDALAGMLRVHEAEAVCGPLVGGAFLAQMLSALLGVPFLFTERMPAEENASRLYGVKYRLPRGLHERVRGRRIAIVDDAISAGSSVRATHDDLCSLGAKPAVVGALLLLGSAALPFFESLQIPVVAVSRVPYELWAPADCPRCAVGETVEELAHDRSQGLA